MQAGDLWRGEKFYLFFWCEIDKTPTHYLQIAISITSVPQKIQIWRQGQSPCSIMFLGMCYQATQPDLSVSAKFKEWWVHVGAYIYSQ